MSVKSIKIQEEIEELGYSSIQEALIAEEDLENV